MVVVQGCVAAECVRCQGGTGSGLARAPRWAEPRPPRPALHPPHHYCNFGLRRLPERGPTPPLGPHQLHPQWWSSRRRRSHGRSPTRRVVCFGGGHLHPCRRSAHWRASYGHCHVRPLWFAWVATSSPAQIGSRRGNQRRATGKSLGQCHNLGAACAVCWTCAGGWMVCVSARRDRGSGVAMNEAAAIGCDHDHVHGRQQVGRHQNHGTGPSSATAPATPGLRHRRQCRCGRHLRTTPSFRGRLAHAQHRHAERPCRQRQHRCALGVCRHAQLGERLGGALGRAWWGLGRCRHYLRHQWQWMRPR